MWTRVAPTKHALGGVRISSTWQIRLNHPCAAAMYQISLTTCYGRRM